MIAIASCSPSTSSPSSPQPWQPMSASETEQAWDYILNSPLGIAALNQLAIEGFISPECQKSFYANEEYGGMQFLLRVECPTARGVSIAVSYEEMRVIFNRFEDNIESFEVERVNEQEGSSVTPLPD